MLGLSTYRIINHCESHSSALVYCPETKLIVLPAPQSELLFDDIIATLCKIYSTLRWTKKDDPHASGDKERQRAKPQPP